MTAPGPIGWASRPVITCEGRSDGGVVLFLGDLETLAGSTDEVAAKVRATGHLRPEGVEMWRLDELTPSSIAAMEPVN
jgi:hypothetical protein